MSSVERAYGGTNLPPNQTGKVEVSVDVQLPSDVNSNR